VLHRAGDADLDGNAELALDVVGVGRWWRQGAQRRSLDREAARERVELQGRLSGGAAHKSIEVDLLHPTAAVEPRYPARHADRRHTRGRRVVGVHWCPLGADLGDGFETDPFEDLADVHGVRTVVDERDDGQDRDDAEHHGNRDRQVRDHRPSAVLERRPDRTQHDDAVGERAHHQRHHPLVERVAEQGVHHSRGVLARGELDDQQRDRKRDAGKGDRGARDRAQQRSGAGDGGRQPERQRGLLTEVAVDGQRGEPDDHGRDDRDHRDEEQAGPEALDQRADSQSHGTHPK